MAYNKAYHRHFEGYTETRVDGKICRVYTGPYFELLVSDEKFRKNKLIYGVCCFGAIALFLAAAVVPAGSNEAWYSTLPQFFSLIVCILLAIKTVSYCLSEKRLTIAEYRKRHPMTILSGLGVIGLALCAATTLLHALLHGLRANRMELLCALAFALAALLLFRILRGERSAEFQKHVQTSIPPTDGYEIKNRERLL